VLEDLIAGRAALAPLGRVGEKNAGYKGYGYSTMVEILSSVFQIGPFLSALTGIENGEKAP
jgi:L-2-hydroxycarboxylate dehydrogenase (NAD+)